MATGMGWLARLDKKHMFVWAWGHQWLLLRVVGAAAMPIIATGFGYGTVLAVSAVAYLVAIPSFFRPVAARHILSTEKHASMMFCEGSCLCSQQLLVIVADRPDAVVANSIGRFRQTAAKTPAVPLVASLVHAFVIRALCPVFSASGTRRDSSRLKTPYKRRYFGGVLGCPALEFHRQRER